MIWKNLICTAAIIKSNEINSMSIFYISLSLSLPLFLSFSLSLTPSLSPSPSLSYQPRGCAKRRERESGRTLSIPHSVSQSVSMRDYYIKTVIYLYYTIFKFSLAGCEPEIFYCVSFIFYPSSAQLQRLPMCITREY